MSKRPDAERPPASVRVLIVDDHEPWRRWVYAQLASQQQFQVVGEASDGLEAVAKADELKPDLILLDIGLPKLNGLEAATRIAQTHHETKIIFLSNQWETDVVTHALNNGAKGYVLKDDANTELFACCRSRSSGWSVCKQPIGDEILKIAIVRKVVVRWRTRCQSVFDTPTSLGDFRLRVIAIRFQELRTL